MPQFAEMRRLADRHRPNGHAGSATERDTVVIGYDGSHAARRALIRAAVAAGNGGQVVVVTAVPTAKMLAEQDEPLCADPEDLIAGARALLAGRDIDVSVRVEEAEPAEALIATAREASAALIVVGARGDSYLARALRGSVAEKLIARSPCDVLVVR